MLSVCCGFRPGGRTIRGERRFRHEQEQKSQNTRTVPRTPPRPRRNLHVRYSGKGGGMTKTEVLHLMDPSRLVKKIIAVYRDGGKDRVA